MPIYEYLCGNCGQRVEILIFGREEALQCPKCGTPLSDKLVSLPHHQVSQGHRKSGTTCCGQEERCSKPPCGSGGGCRRDLH